MSKLSQRRKKMGYDRDVPRCATCVNFRKPYVYLTINSATKKSPAFCKVGDFSVVATGYCNSWVGKDGATLDTAAIAQQASGDAGKGGA